MNLKLTSWLSNRIASERKRLRLTLKDVSKYCQVSLAEWKRFECGETCPNSETFFLMSKLGMNMNFLFTGEYFTDEEIALIEQYRNISPFEQSIIHTIIYKFDKFFPREHISTRVNIKFMPDENDKSPE